MLSMYGVALISWRPKQGSVLLGVILPGGEQLQAPHSVEIPALLKPGLRPSTLSPIQLGFPGSGCRWGGGGPTFFR